jgi:hypothetical protein
MNVMNTVCVIMKSSRVGFEWIVFFVVGFVVILLIVIVIVVVE